MTKLVIIHEQNFTDILNSKLANLKKYFTSESNVLHIFIIQDISQKT